MIKPVINSYVFHEDKCWNVSTIYRQSSALSYIDWYYEIIVWEYDMEKKVRGRLVHQDEGLENHFAICRTIIQEGAFWEE